MDHQSAFPPAPARLLTRLARDTGGNTMMLVAAALLPLLAMVGGGIDMGRGYVVQTRLQHACDAGVLAARKRLGSQVAVSNNVPDEAAAVGQRFFDANFPDGDYATEDRDFSMIMESDYAITGEAEITVPTTIMDIFGYEDLPVTVTCQAQINMSNTDVMMVLDTTGSMNWINPNDTVPRIDALRATVKSFHAQLEANKPSGTRIRYGFLPYSTNINVGYLLEDDWLVDRWQYNFRRARTESGTTETPTYETAYEYISGSATDTAPVLQSSCPASTQAYALENEIVDSEGWTIQTVLETGTVYSCAQIDANVFEVTSRTFNAHRFYWKFRQTGTTTQGNATWRYRTYGVDLSFLETSDHRSFPIGGVASNPVQVDAWYRGCVEERDTYEITDYDDVDLDRALDLDLDRIPDPADPRTQWRPMLHDLSFIREMRHNGTGMFTPGTVDSDEDFVNAEWSGFSSCPSPARLPEEMNAAEIADYVDNLIVHGATYHDIGMIWGGRLLSPTGLFAAHNADTSSVQPTSRHLIFLTDGETSPFDLTYSTYGMEPLDRRRWRPTSPMTLTQTVENRFSYACQQVKNRNITVWIISFGTAANPIMQNCAGANRYFVADDAAQLSAAFSTIANRMAELRVTN